MTAIRPVPFARHLALTAALRVAGWVAVGAGWAYRAIQQALTRPVDDVPAVREGSR